MTTLYGRYDNSYTYSGYFRNFNLGLDRAILCPAHRYLTRAGANQRLEANSAI